MITRVISVATLLTFVNCIAGCTSVSTFPRDRLNDIHAHQRARVTEVKLPYHKSLQFDRLGGRLDKKSRRVIGVGPKGDWIRVYYRDIVELTLAVPQSTGWRESQLGPDEFTSAKSGTSWSRIVGVNTRAGERLKFDKRGGLFLLPERKLMGYQPTGELVSLAYDDIADIRLRHSDPTETAIIILGASVAATALVIFAVQMDRFGDSGCCF